MSVDDLVMQGTSSTADLIFVCYHQNILLTAQKGFIIFLTGIWVMEQYAYESHLKSREQSFVATFLD